MSIITKKSLVAAGILTALIAGNVAMAADVPAGVQLAEKQTLVRNNGAEVQSLDPHKIEGVPESNVNRDLFEGLLVTDVDGHPVAGVAEKSGPSTCVKTQNGLMVPRLPHKISFIAGSAWRIQTPPLRTRAICSMATSPISMTSSPAKNRLPTSA